MGDRGAVDADTTEANVVEGVLLALIVDMNRMIVVKAGVSSKETSQITEEEVKTPLLEDVEKIGMELTLKIRRETIGIDREITSQT